MNNHLKLFFYSILLSLSISAIAQEYWDFENAQRWIGNTAEGLVEFCEEKSIRWTNPQLGFDINKDSIDDFMLAISCYQGNAADGTKHNLKVRAAWKMYCSDEQKHYDCTSELFGTDVIEVTSVPADIELGNDGGGNPYIQVSEVPRDLNNDGYPEFWYATNRDDGRPGFSFGNSDDRTLLETYCGPQGTGESASTWDCTRKSIQTMLISRSDGTYQIRKLPWKAQNTQAMIILPNELNTFDAWALNYGPGKVARYKDGEFLDVTSEYESYQNWSTIDRSGNPYIKGFTVDNSFYIAKADIPSEYRPTWAKNVANSGFVLWKFTAGVGFEISDVYSPKESETFYYKIQSGDSTQTKYGAIVRDVPIFEPRWHFFDLQVLDESGRPTLIVQTESFAQAGDSFKAPHSSNITYRLGNLDSASGTTNTIFGARQAVEGFHIIDGKLVSRDRDVIEGNAIDNVSFKRFYDINADGYLDMIASSGGAVRPSVFINDGNGTLFKLFLGDIFPDLFNDKKYWQVSEDNNTVGWGALVYPFYNSKKIDLLYWTKGYANNLPSHIGENYIFSPGDIVVTKGSTEIDAIKKFSTKEQHTLFETCISKGLYAIDGYQLACELGILFPNASEIDSDNDGVYDDVDAFRFDDSEHLDTDSDGTGNNVDIDDDGDGVLDNDDVFPLDSNESADSDSDGAGDNVDAFPNDSTETLDSDSDNVGDNSDNCPNVANTNQVDSDNDTLGNLCDEDDDGDTVLDVNDAFPLDATETIDTDSDGTGNNADTDDDNDSVLDSEDAFPLDASETLDTDSDGIGNNADTDDDGDTLLDNWETTNGRDPLVADYLIKSVGSSTCMKDDEGIKCWNKNATGTSTVITADIGAFDGASPTCYDIDSKLFCTPHSAPLTGGAAETPIPETLGDVLDFGVGQWGMCARTNTELECWGWYGEYQFSNPPIQSAEELSVGKGHACAISSNNLYCWGYGVGFSENKPPTLTNPRMIRSAKNRFNHSCAFGDEGFKCWGTGLEDGWYGTWTVPNLDQSEVIDYSLSIIGGCALKSDSSTICWGGRIDKLDYSNLAITSENSVQISLSDQLCLLNETGVTCSNPVPQGLMIDPDGDGHSTQNGNDAFPLDSTEWLDTDSDGIGNNADLDDDGDEVNDNLDAFPLDKTETTDTDSDGIGNNADTDDDGDSISDSDEASNGTNPLLADTDGDGVNDNIDAFPLDASETLDTDSDGTGNNADTDDDGDGVLDDDDAFPLDATETLDTDSDGIGNNADTDDDGDGVDDGSDAFPLDATETLDTDSDGTGNNADTDDDGDGVLDGSDAFPLDATESIDTDSDGTGNNADTDDDGDGVDDGSDAFPLDATETLDTDSDGTGNNADTDDDGDGVLDGSDAFPLDATESIDTDSDGTGNNADTDDDNDTVLDIDDAFPLDSTETLDTDSDGTGNNTDTDDDGDGVLDTNDNLPLDPTNDSDGDGVANNADVYPENNLYSKDSDSDGMPDAWETKYGLNPNDASDATSDIDNDGVTALDEFLAGTIPSGSLDIDGNDQYDALTDGLLLLRGLFGLDGSALITGTIASDAAYTESVDIESRIATLGELADIDGNGEIDALTDGLLTLRYLFGLQGDTLINGVVASDATRKTAEEIEAHLETLMPAI